MARNLSKYNEEKSNMKFDNCNRDSQNNKTFASVFEYCQIFATLQK